MRTIHPATRASSRGRCGRLSAAHPPSLLYENPAPVAHGVMTTPFYAAIVSCSLRSALRGSGSHPATPTVSCYCQGHFNRRGPISDGVGRFPCPEAPYSADKLNWGGELVHYLVGARFGGLLEARGVEVGAQDQHGRIGVGPAQIRDQVRPVPVGKAEIKDRNVEAHLRCVSAGFGKRSGLSNHLKIRLPG